MAPLLIGLFIFTAVAAIGPASGGSFNPARSLATALYNGSFGDVWIYLAGPLLGGMIGGALWLLFAPKRVAEPVAPAGRGLPQGDGRSDLEAALRSEARRSREPVES